MRDQAIWMSLRVPLYLHHQPGLGYSCYVTAVEWFRLEVVVGSEREGSAYACESFCFVLVGSCTLDSPQMCQYLNWDAAFVTEAIAVQYSSFAAIAPS